MTITQAVLLVGLVMIIVFADVLIDWMRAIAGLPKLEDMYKENYVTHHNAGPLAPTEEEDKYDLS
jgi:hypothetical protein